MVKPLEEYAGLSAEERRQKINAKISERTLHGTCEACGKERKNLAGHVLSSSDSAHKALAVKLGLRR